LTCFIVVPPWNEEYWLYAVKTAAKRSIRLAFIEKLGDGHLRIAFGAERQVFDGQVNDFRIAALWANDLDGFTVTSLHDALQL
jgi:hypothetical protein